MALTIDQYLQPIPNVTFPANYVLRVLEMFAITPGVLASTVSQRNKDLAEAEMWYAAAQMTSGGSYSKRINNRSMSENMATIDKATRTQWLETANALRAKWGVAAFKSTEGIYDASFYWGIVR